MKNRTVQIALFAVLLLSTAFFISAKNTAVQSASPTPQPAEPQPVELGKVQWGRNLGEAQKRSEAEQKPILTLFQEVPGCATCQRYGNGALSHPLIVEAIESEFVPLAIFNNKKGEDAAALKHFGEPAWNNPVVRIVNEKKQDIVPRLGGDYSEYGLVNSMLLALNAANRVAPRYLQLLAEEMQAEITGTETATLSMSCFWTGEKELAQVPGVVATEAGWMGGREVVQVEYNPLVTSYADLLSEAKKPSCASHVFAEGQQLEEAGKVVGESAVSPAGKYRTDSEPKYYLGRSIYQYVPMTALQSAKANSLVGQRQLPNEVLSPRQIELADFIVKNQNLKWEKVIGVELGAAWGKVEKVRQKAR